MPLDVIGSDGRPVGQADQIRDGMLRLRRAGAPRWLPAATVAAQDGAVLHLAIPSDRVAEAMLTEAEMAEQRALPMPNPKPPQAVEARIALALRGG